MQHNFLLTNESKKNARQIRFLAIQAVYSFWINELADNKKHTNIILEKYDKENFKKSNTIIEYTMNNIEKIDTQIKNNISENWTIDRINLVSISILRTAIAEIESCFICDINKTIYSYLSIAESMLEKNDVFFINAILTKIYHMITSFNPNQIIEEKTLNTNAVA